MKKQFSATWMRAFALFVNLFMIILAYYQVKPASRSLILESGDADVVPWLRILTAVLLLVLMPFYQKLLQRVTRLNIVIGSGSLFAASLIVLYFILQNGSWTGAAVLFVLTNIMSVVMVEQFWSLTNSTHSTENASKSYWLISSGGLLGGLAGGLFAKMLIGSTSLATLDLLIVAAAMISLVLICTIWMAHNGFYPEQEQEAVVKTTSFEGLKTILSNRYITLVAVLLLLAQAAEPIIEYQFLSVAEQAYPEQESRTEFLSGFFALISGAGLLINLLFTHVIHRYLGVVAGLLAQPVLIGASAIAFFFQPGLWTASIMRLLDRSLSYSIGRASREVFYTPIEPNMLYAAKAWIDMFGYRASQLLGASIITITAAISQYVTSVEYFSIAIMGLAVLWLWVVFALHNDYRRLKEAV